MHNRPTRLIMLTATALVALLSPTTTAQATGAVPSGQRTLGGSVIEPLYDQSHEGDIHFISTSEHAPSRAADAAVAPLYLPVYPRGSSVGALICPHQPTDSCPDHGPAIAGLAAATAPSLYGEGVAGHDHVGVVRGSRSGFATTFRPVVVLFTNRSAANEHLLTEAAIDAAVRRGDAVTVTLGGSELHAAPVPITVWRLATPAS